MCVHSWVFFREVLAQIQMSLYDVLLVDQNATLEEIKLAFKRRALQVHPDKGGSKEEFHLVYQALETLGDPAARKKYDHTLATTTEISTDTKRKKRKRAEQNAHPTTSSKAEPPAPKSRKSSAGKARSGWCSTPAGSPQSKQTKLLMKIRDLLKQLPRGSRNEVISKQLSQKQRVILERFMVDNADTSSGSEIHSEAKALAPAATSKTNATKQAGFEIDTRQSTADSSHGSRSVVLPTTNSMTETQRSQKTKKRVRGSCDVIGKEGYGARTSGDVTNLTIGEGCYALAVPNSKCGRRPDVRMTRAKPAGKMKAKDKKVFNAKARSNGWVQKQGSLSALYLACIRLDSLEMRTSKPCDLKTALEDLMVLTAVKQKMLNHTDVGTFVERLHAAVVSSAAEHGRSLTDLKLNFLVHQSAGRFIGYPLRSPFVRSLELLGKMRSVLQPFRQYAKVGRLNVYAQFSPVHLEDAWERFQLAVVEAWKIAGVDSTAFVQKICSLYELRAPYRSASLQLWERQHMAMCDKNKHRPERLRERNHTGRLEHWERLQMSMQDKNKHRPKKLRQKLDLRKCTSESRLSKQLSSLRKLIARWGHMLKREAKLVVKERQKVIKEQKAQQKKDQEERRRVEILKQKQQREVERLRREWIRQRMRSDLTMDDILGPKECLDYF